MPQRPTARCPRCKTGLMKYEGGVPAWWSCMMCGHIAYVDQTTIGRWEQADGRLPRSGKYSLA